MNNNYNTIIDIRKVNIQLPYKKRDYNYQILRKCYYEFFPYKLRKKSI